MEWVLPVISIVIIDLILAGDNAVVIGMASRRLTGNQRRQAILLGAAGATGLRVLFTILIAYLLRVPLLQGIGGALLVWIAVSLMIDRRHLPAVEADQLSGAVRTIIMADALMSLDNVLAVAGASHGNPYLIVFGLLLSMPLVIFASQGMAALMGRFPAIVYVGAGVLAWTAGSMLAGDRWLRAWLGGVGSIGIPCFTVALVLVAGFWLNQRHAPAGFKQ